MMKQQVTRKGGILTAVETKPGLLSSGLCKPEATLGPIALHSPLLWPEENFRVYSKIVCAKRAKFLCSWRTRVILLVAQRD